MSKFNFDKFEPMLEKAEGGLAKAGKAAVEIIQDRNFQLGVLTALPSTVSAFFLIKKYRKEVEEKDKLYMEVLAKHNAVIKELSAQAKLGNERPERLLAYDAALKKKMDSLLSERQELLNQISELKEKKANDE